MSQSPRFLIVQLADIGDLVLSTPALAALRAAHPDAHIAVLTTAHAAQVLPPALVNEVIVFDKHTFDSPRALLKPRNLRRAVGLAAKLRAGRFDTTLIFHHFSTRFGALKFAALAWSAGSRRIIGLENGSAFFLTERLTDEGFGARHQAQYWLDLVALTGASSAPRPAQIAISDSDRAWAADVLGNASGLRVAFHAGSGGYSLARRWDAERFARAADTLAQQRQAQIIWVGGKGDDTAQALEHLQTASLDLTGKTSLGQLAAVLERCDLFIGADSGVMHIAAAVGTRIVAIFGPSNHRAWQPWLPPHRLRLVRSAPECSPCSYVGTGIGLRSGCAARTCMRMVSSEQVAISAFELLDLPQDAAGDYPVPGRMTDVQPAAPQIRILGVPVSIITNQRWLALISEWVKAGKACQHVCTVNPEMVMMARQDVNFYNILQRVTLCVPDGVGLLWAARRQGQPLPERVTGSDGVPRIAAEAAEQGWRLFFLGAGEGIAARAADVLRQRHPQLQIVGTFAGSPSPAEEDDIVARINASQADLLFVAYGAPEQDKWIARNAPRLQVKMAMGVGGSLDFVAGVVPRAPAWMQNAGLEWLFRLWRQPWRIKRMARLPRFVLAVLRETQDNRTSAPTD